MNRLVLTDEEDAEYRSFESLIATNVIFKKSNVMLCIFHAIWQPFKRVIYPLCPKKSKKGKPLELSKVGSAWAEHCLLIIGDFFLQLYSYIQCTIDVQSDIYIQRVSIPSCPPSVLQSMLPLGPDRQSGLGIASGSVPGSRKSMSQ